MYTRALRLIDGRSRRCSSYLYKSTTPANGLSKTRAHRTRERGVKQEKRCTCCCSEGTLTSHGKKRLSCTSGSHSDRSHPMSCKTLRWTGEGRSSLQLSLNSTSPTANYAIDAIDSANNYFAFRLPSTELRGVEIDTSKVMILLPHHTCMQQRDLRRKHITSDNT